MKLTYDRQARIAGIGLVPWTRLGPERWFDEYKIAALYDWDLPHQSGMPEVVVLSTGRYGMPELEHLRTQQLIETPEFQQMALDRLPGYHFLTYKPVQPPSTLTDAGCRFISMNQTLTQTLENKAEFRQNFVDVGVPFPPYQIVERHAITADAAGLRRLLGKREVAVMQDEQLSGGRGTFMIRSVDDLAKALEAIERLRGGGRVVVSDKIEHVVERSVQCVATRYGVFVGPLQKQIIAHPLLANLAVADGDRFCGGEISPTDPMASAYPAIRARAMRIGERLMQMGYRGIFGIDCLVDGGGKVFVLEINPRLTGMTPLLTMLYREGHDIPFYLLHILELSGMDYTIDDAFVDPAPPEGGLLILHSQQPWRARIIDSPSSGWYDPSSLTYQGKQCRLGNDQAGKLLLQQYTPPGFRLSPGGRLMCCFVHGRVLDDADHLLPEVQQSAQMLLQRIKLERVEEV